MADAANAPEASFKRTRQSRYKQAIWTMSGVSTCVPVLLANYPDKCFQVFDGTWGGATVVLEGSLDEKADPSHADHANATWGTLTDTTETAISTGVDLGPITVLQNPMWVRPKSTGGTGTTVYACLGSAK